MAERSRQRVVTLSASKAGMTRLRYKGGASPETLYELTNGYINASRCPQQRPGTTWKFNFADPATGHSGNAGYTKGLVAFQGVLWAFSARAITSGSNVYKIQRLIHPTNGSADLKAIHFAQPFMGELYVVAEFLDGVIAHYWLQNVPAWQGWKLYMDNDLVQPTTANGYYYRANRIENPNAWTPVTLYAINDKIQPTQYSGWWFKALAEGGAGTPPARSGTIEPAWNYQVASTSGPSPIQGNVTALLTFDFSTSSPAVENNTAPTPPDFVPTDAQPGGRYDNSYRGDKRRGFAK